MRLNNERLTGSQVDEFRNALRDAFDDEQEFKEFLLTQLDRRLNDFTSKDTFPTEIFNIIEAADTGDWTEELLRAARLWRPTNMKLLMFAEQFGLTPSTPPNTNLKSVFERMVRPNNKVVDVAVWRKKLEQIEGQICRVEVRDGGETTFGTGFLLGPDVVMTNYHVVRDVIKGDVSPENVSFLFDFKKTIDASLAGIPYHLAEQDWYIDCSEPDSLDEFNNPWDRAADENRLDYALMRLSTRIGEERIGGKANKNPGALPRGWIEVPTTGSKLLRDREVFILQHKDGDELTLALDTHSIIRTNLNNTRVFYKTNTDEGSSGAPCFDIEWQLVALHQGGDTNNKPEYNQGIPFSAIVKLLKNRGKLDALGVIQNKEPSKQYAEDSDSTQESDIMEAYSEQQESNEPSPVHEVTSYEQACKYFHEAYTCLQKASDPLQEGMYIPHAIFRASIQHLQDMQKYITMTIEYLQSATLLPPDVAREQLTIIHQLRVINDNVTLHLRLFLSQDRSGNFTPISDLMHAIEEKLLPADIVSLQEMQQIKSIQTSTSAPGDKQATQKEGTVVTSQPIRTGVFISYSHKDKRYLDELHTHLALYVRSGLVKAWDDTMILPGTKWLDEINKAIQSAKVAILLVSADFLASDFIARKELPPLLKAAEHEGTTILCIILRPCAFSDTEFAQYQAISSTSNPLSNMSRGKRDAKWEEVATRVKDILQDK